MFSWFITPSRPDRFLKISWSQGGRDIFALLLLVELITYWIREQDINIYNALPSRTDKWLTWRLIWYLYQRVRISRIWSICKLLNGCLYCLSLRTTNLNYNNFNLNTGLIKFRSLILVGFILFWKTIYMHTLTCLFSISHWLQKISFSFCFVLL